MESGACNYAERSCSVSGGLELVCGLSAMWTVPCDRVDVGVSKSVLLKSTFWQHLESGSWNFVEEVAFLVAHMIKHRIRWKYQKL